MRHFSLKNILVPLLIAMIFFIAGGIFYAVIEKSIPIPEANIVVTKPNKNDSVGIPLIIEGKARVFESTFSYRIKDSKGNIIYESHAMSNAPDAGLFGNFRLTVVYPKPQTATGFVEVFEYSAKDGSEINKVIVPVKFRDFES